MPISATIGNIEKSNPFQFHPTQLFDVNFTSDLSGFTDVSRSEKAAELMKSKKAFWLRGTTNPGGSTPSGEAAEVEIRKGGYMAAFRILEQDKGVEPSSLAWEANALPMC